MVQSACSAPEPRNPDAVGLVDGACPGAGESSAAAPAAMNVAMTVTITCQGCRKFSIVMRQRTLRPVLAPAFLTWVDELPRALLVVPDSDNDDGLGNFRPWPGQRQECGTWPGK